MDVHDHDHDHIAKNHDPNNKGVARKIALTK
ncbi:Uncharacterised protein [Chlamydia trachomatis]|nr:Uncharacterised protein [Chlamydia trachomatis]